MIISRRSRLIGGLVTLSIVTSCSFGAESTSRPIPDRQRGTLSVAFGSPLSLNGEARVYLPRLDVDSGPFLGSVPRTIEETDEEAFLVTLVNDLIAGPSADEQASGFDSAVPPGTQVLSVTPAVSRVTIDLSGSFDRLDDKALVVALAQIVYTLSEGFFIREVIIKVDGQSKTWPRQDGSRTSDPLTIFDYPTAAISSQPAYPGIFSAESSA